MFSSDLLISNITNPAFLFFLLGIVAVRIKSDLEIPPNSSRFISLYLLFAIGFKGGQELSHEGITLETIGAIFFGIGLSIVIPVYSFFILKKKLSVYNAAAIAAAYGSVSAVTFVTAVSYLEQQKLMFHGHMVAIMALMESPAIIAGLALMSLYNKNESKLVSNKHVLRHSFTNGSVVMILGSLLIGYLADAKQAEGIKPFTNDIFKGFLALFLLDMGITSGRQLQTFVSSGWFPIAFAIVMPLVNGCVFTILSTCVAHDVSSRFMFGILAASASYIAVPAAMKLTNPKAEAGLYIPMALAITFPLNITMGMPLYLWIAKSMA